MKVISIDLTKVQSLKAKLTALLSDHRDLERKCAKAQENLIEVRGLEIVMEEAGEDNYVIRSCGDSLTTFYLEMYDAAEAMVEEIKALEAELDLAETELHVYYNGFKTKRDGKFSKLMKGWWDHREANSNKPERIVFYADTYGNYGPLVRSFFDTLVNNSDSMSDLFYTTDYEVYVGGENYEVAEKMILDGREKARKQEARRQAKRNQRRAA